MLNVFLFLAARQILDIKILNNWYRIQNPVLPSLAQETIWSPCGDWRKNMYDSCFCAYALLYWVGSGIGLSMCVGNDENWWAKTKSEDKQL
jgi:hypothetical protein